MERGGTMQKPFFTALVIILCIFAVAIAAVAIRDGSEIIAGVGQYVMHQFQ